MRNKKMLTITSMILVTCFFFVATTSMAQSGEDEKGVAASKGKLIIKSKSGAKLTVTKAELTTRPGARRVADKSSRRITPSELDPSPTTLKLTFPTLVYPGDEVRGKLKFNDKDDYVFSIFITVFFPDGDVVTDTLYDYRDDGGDVFKGTYNFYIEIPESETPLPGKIIITCADEYLNVSEVSRNFVTIF